MCEQTHVRVRKFAVMTRWCALCLPVELTISSQPPTSRRAQAPTQLWRVCRRPCRQSQRSCNRGRQRIANRIQVVTCVGYRCVLSLGRFLFEPTNSKHSASFLHMCTKSWIRASVRLFVFLMPKSCLKQSCVCALVRLLVLCVRGNRAGALGTDKRGEPDVSLM